MDDARSVSPLPRKRAPNAFQTVARWELDGPSHLARLRRELGAAVREIAGPHPNLSSLTERMALVATELATNAMRHGHPPTLVELRADRRSFLVDVADHDPSTRPAPTGARDPGDGGFGLLIIREFVDDAGWYRSRATKHVWARLA